MRGLDNEVLTTRFGEDVPFDRRHNMEQTLRVWGSLCFLPEGIMSSEGAALETAAHAAHRGQLAEIGVPDGPCGQNHRAHKACVGKCTEAVGIRNLEDDWFGGKRRCKGWIHDRRWVFSFEQHTRAFPSKVRCVPKIMRVSIALKLRTFGASGQ